MTNYLCIFLTLNLLLGFSTNVVSIRASQIIQTVKMSTSALKIISTDPSYIPLKTQLDNAKKFLSKIYKAEKTEYITTETIEFVDQGENFVSVSCNLCGREINMESWQVEMDKAYKKQFSDLVFITPCCHKKTSLNDLHYKSPAGFAKFFISIMDPQNGLTEMEIKQLQDVLGTKLRIVWARY